MLARDTNLIQEGAALWLLSHYVNKTLAHVLNSRMCDRNTPTPITASVRNSDATTRALHRSYSEVANCLLNKFARDQKIADIDAAILHYMQLLNPTLQQYTDDMFSSSCKVADFYDQGMLYDVLIEGVSASVRQSFRHCWAESPIADLTDITFQAESLLFIQKKGNCTSINIQNSFNSDKHFNRNPRNRRNNGNNASTRKTSPSQSSRRRYESPQVLEEHTPNAFHARLSTELFISNALDKSVILQCLM